MRTNYTGTTIIGAPTLQTSVANANITSGFKTVLNFSIMNDQDMTVVVNDGANIFIRADQGLFVDTVLSFKITTAGITYNWTGMLG